MTEANIQPGGLEAGGTPAAEGEASPGSTAACSGQEPAPDAPGRLGRLLLCCLLFALVFGTFRPATQYDFVKYDDPEYVTDNPHVQGGLTWESLRWAFGSTAATNWHPLTWVSHMLDCQWYGLAPRGHHLTSILLHSANTLLVFLVLRRMTRATWRSFAAAALFGLHPLRIESVVWVAERKDVLSAAFWMLTLWAYAAYAGASRAPRFKATLYYALTLLLFALGLLSKPMLVTLPFALLLLDFWPLGRFRTGNCRRLVLEKVPFLLISAAASVVTFEVQRRWGAVSAAHPFPDRFGNAVVSYCRYLGKLLYPEKLACFYPQQDPWPLWVVVTTGLALAALTLLALAWRRRHPYLPAGWLWYLGTLVPVIGLVQVGEQALADRYTYIPSIGILVLAVWSAHAFAGRSCGGRAALSLAAVALCGLCAASTRSQMGYWRDSETLFRRALAVTRNNYVMHGNLGTTLSAKGRLEESVAEYREAIRIKPDGADAHSNLGASYEKLGRLPEAIQEFVTAVRLNPGLPAAHYNLANALAESGQQDAAIGEYQTALKLRPGWMDPLFNLGNTLGAAGHLDAAIARYTECLAIDPRSDRARFNLGIALGRQGRLDAALAEFETLLKWNPDWAEAHAACSAILEKQGRLDEAVQHALVAARLSPADPQTHLHLGVLLGRRGRLDGAIAEFREALRLKPDDAKARADLEKALRLQKEEGAPQK